jgi:hypothetical protein
VSYAKPVPELSGMAPPKLGFSLHNLEKGRF